MDSEYTKIVKDHFFHPRNVGRLTSPSGSGTVGNPSCGDVMTIDITVEDNHIKEAKFQTYGCAAAIASGSITTEIIKGKSIDECMRLKMDEAKQILKKIADTLDHKVIIPNKSTVVSTKKEKQSIELQSLGKTYVFPEIDCVLLPISSSSAEHLAEYFLHQFLETLGKDHNLTKIEIGIDEGYGQGAWIIESIK